MLPCPICSKPFPSAQIEDHVNRCLDGGSPMMEKSKETPKKPNEEQPKKPQEGGADFLNAQEEYYNFWRKKIQQVTEHTKSTSDRAFRKRKI